MAVSVKSPRRSGGIVPLDDTTIELTYTRVSSDEQADEGVSIQAQLEECRRYSGRHDDWIAGAEFSDVESGTRADRDDYQGLLQAVRGHALARRRVVVVVAKVDRLGRNPAESVRAWDELKKLGVEIHSVRDGGRMTEMHYNLMAVFAQEESRRIGERVRSSWRYFEERGWHRPGRPAWGFRYRPATDEERADGAPKAVLEVHELEASYAHEMWTRYAGGEGVEGILRWIAGLPDVARGGRTLRSSTVRMLLCSPVYVGRLGGPHDLAECVESGDRCAVLDQPRARWGALIDDETWQRAHRQYRRMSRLPMQASGDFLLTGIMRCPSCNGRMIGNAGDRSRSDAARKRYVCSSRKNGDLAQRVEPCYRTIPARQLEEAVVESVREIIEHAADPTLRAKIRASIARRAREEQRALDEGARPIARLETDLARARKMLSAASQKFFADEISRTAYDVTAADLTEQIESLTAELERLRGRVRRVEPQPIETLLRIVDGLAASLAATELPDWRPVLSELVERVTPVRVGYGKYEAGLELTSFGKRLVAFVCDVAPSRNLVAIRTLGKAKGGVLFSDR
jgi:site-specific DNA recombinase